MKGTITPSPGILYLKQTSQIKSNFETVYDVTDLDGDLFAKRAGFQSNVHPLYDSAQYWHVSGDAPGQPTHLTTHSHEIVSLFGSYTARGTYFQDYIQVRGPYSEFIGRPIDGTHWHVCDTVGTYNNARLLSGKRYN